MILKCVKVDVFWSNSTAGEGIFLNEFWAPPTTTDKQTRLKAKSRLIVISLSIRTLLSKSPKIAHLFLRLIEQPLHKNPFELPFLKVNSWDDKSIAQKMVNPTTLLRKRLWHNQYRSGDTVVKWTSRRQDVVLYRIILVPLSQRNSHRIVTLRSPWKWSSARSPGELVSQHRSLCIGPHGPETEERHNRKARR